MKKIDIGQTIAILANLAVLAGIVFLAIQIRQNTETQRLSAAQQVLGLSNTNGFAVATDRNLAEALATYQSGGEVTPGMEGQLLGFTRGVMSAYWQVYVLRQYGFIEDDIFYAYERRVQSYFRTSRYVNEWWPENKELFPEDFRVWVDGLAEAD